MNNSCWRTAWHGQDIVVYRDDTEIDRVGAPRIERIVFVYSGNGESPGDLLHAVVQTAEHFLIFPADTGFAGRVNFERVDYWAERGCVYWVHQSQAPLPLRLRRGRWWLRMAAPHYTRMARDELASLVEHWPLEGPQTWEQRKWRRIERSRPFTKASKAESERRARA
jgi:hypothetical protein